MATEPGAATALRLVLDEDKIREWYDEYVGDVAYYKAAGELSTDHPDQGYRTGVPNTYEEYRQSCLEGILEDVVGESTGYRVEVVDAAA